MTVANRFLADQNSSDNPTGISIGHYQGPLGSKYFDWQNQKGNAVAQLEARKFSAYIKSTDVVLDFGCGGGQILLSLPCKARFGVEVNPAAREFARRQGIECHDSIAFFPDEFFDVVVSHHALEHVAFPIEALTALRNKLKAGGCLVLCVPIDDWRTQKRYCPDDVNHHLQTWTPQLLGNTLYEAGFKYEQISISILTSAWHPKFLALHTKVSIRLFDLCCRAFAVWTRRRQLLALARKDTRV